MSLNVYAFHPDHPDRKYEPTPPRNELFGTQGLLRAWIALGREHDLVLFRRLAEPLPIEWAGFELADLAAEVQKVLTVLEGGEAGRTFGFYLANLLAAVRLARADPGARVTVG